ncbi:MAG TPA: amidase family protein [Gemmatimonadaceae bacterium]|nr:amidase family protein [Gemmatimonadaceae bacterium]
MTLLPRAALASLLLACTPALSLAQATAPFDVHEASIRDLQAAMTDGRTTAVALVDAYLARIEAYDRGGPRINAIIRLNPRAREQAAALDRERRAGRVRGIWHGIPIVLKDNFENADMPATGGSAALATIPATRDGFIVKRLRDAGAIILGMANMQELAFGFENASGLGGQTLNPYDLRRCPGGSSGGTGAAIAASFAAIGWGTDTCGSIRVPSSFNNLVGLRPTQGIASRDGILPLTINGDIPGPMARSITDLAIGLDITVGADSADTTTHVARTRPLPRFVDSLSATSLRGARIGVFLPYFRDAHPDVASTVRAAIRAMQAQGAEIVEVNVPLDTFAANTSLVFAEMRLAMDAWLAGLPRSTVRTFADLVATGLHHQTAEGRIRPASAITSEDAARRIAAVNTRRTALRAAIVGVLDSLRLDALVYPTTRQVPAPLGEVPQGISCALGAHSGFPSLAMPAGFTSEGVPVGLELLGRPFADARLVSLGYAFEQSGSRRRAPVTTPPLGVNVAESQVRTVVTAGNATGRVVLTFSRGRDEVAWGVLVSGVSPADVLGVYLQRADSAGTRMVLHRLVAAGALRGEGRGLLRPSERVALQAGRLSVRLVTRAVPSGRGSVVTIPSSQ